MRLLDLYLFGGRVGFHRWPRLILVFLGLIALTAAIWFGGEMIGIWPFDTFSLRFWLIVAIWTFALFIWQFRLWRRRRAARKIEEALIPAQPQGDGKVLAERMQQALNTLRKSGGRSYLYDLPWYVIIGPPGAGKTTSLLNSGIEFPVSQNGNAVEGFGGTRYCDWWFAEEAILIDTAGRYTTQDSDATADGASWKSFLELLKKSRPKQPINGVMLAFPLDELMTSDEDSRARHAEIIRTRLAEIQEALKVDFPVYVLFTKADLIAGFREYFASFSQSRRHAVWGTTFQTKDRKALTWEGVPAEYDKLTMRLSEEVLDRLNEEPDGVSRIAIFGLPGQMALLRNPVADFLRRIFEPTRYKSNAILRGFYFTSGTQEGTPIDQVLGSVAQTGGLDPAFGAGFMSGKGKSYFLRDLLSKVIFAERDWVSHDRRAVRRDRWLRGGATALILGATVATLGAFGYSYWYNTNLVKQAAARTESYAHNALPELERVEVTDPALDDVLPLLDDLRNMPAGYQSGYEGGVLEHMGLGQEGRLRDAATKSYSDALELMLRPRLLLSVQMALADLQNRGDITGVYRALKVYLLLGRQGGQKDDDAILGWFDAEWREAYPGGGQLNLRDRLKGHLQAMLQLDSTSPSLVSLDAELVERAREAIVQLPPAEQAYALIMDGSAAGNLPDWNLVERVGKSAPLVLTTRDGSDLSQMVVPAAFTYEGFWSWFYPQVLVVADELRKDQWVLGDSRAPKDFELGITNLDRLLMDRYRQDFHGAWGKVLGNLALNSMVADKPEYRALGAAASATASPILVLVQEVEEQTRLSREFAGLEGITPDMLASGSLTGDVNKAVLDRLRSRTGGVQRILFDAVAGGAKTSERPGGSSEDNSLARVIARIDGEFSMWYELLQGEQGVRPIDAVIGNLGSIWSNLRLAENSPQQAAAMQPELLSNLTQFNSQLPDPLAALVNDAEADFRQGASDASLETMNRALQDQITYFCRDVIAPSYPFARSDRNLSMENFAKFFGYGGDMDRYYSEYLAPHVERTSNGLNWRADSPLASRLSLQPLRQFERAEKIRQAFFAGGSAKPQVEISVSHIESHPSVRTATLLVNDTRIDTIPREAPKPVIWPGNGSSTVLQLSPAQDGQNSLGFTGSSWTFISFLNAASARSTRGDTTRATFIVGGRNITYDFTINAMVNPFTMPELAEFECPTSLD